MPPNASEMMAEARTVGDFEAEATDNLKQKGEGPIKKRRMVRVKTFSMDTELPEQGTWHYNRKKAILQAHPEVKRLYGQNPLSFLVMLCGVFAQTYVGLQMVNYSWPTILVISYTLGTYLSWVCMVMGHEGSHGLVFPNKALNKIHTIIAFLPVFIGPFGAFWSIEHMYHHQIVVDKMNRYGPQQNSVVKKILFSLLFINAISILFFLTSIVAATRASVHFVRHLLGHEKTPFPESYKMKPFSNFPQVASSPWFFVNLAALAVFNGIIYTHYGMTPIVYFFLCNGFCNGLHPLGMRQVQEHYMQNKNQPTNSVYTSLHWPLLNIGYHNEHHDFPTIPWNRLPQLKAMAPEFYDNLFSYPSYTAVLIDFLTNPGIPYTALLEDYDDHHHHPAASKKAK